MRSVFVSPGSTKYITDAINTVQSNAIKTCALRTPATCVPRAFCSPILRFGSATRSTCCVWRYGWWEGIAASYCKQKQLIGVLVLSVLYLKFW